MTAFAQLAHSIESDDSEAVRKLLADNPDLRARLNNEMPGGSFGATPLLVALHHDNPAIMQMLLDAGADINQKSHWWAGGFGVLDHAHKHVHWLLERGATLSAYSAARWGMVDELRRIIADNPASVHMRGGDGQTPLHVASTVECATLLLDHDADIDAIDVDHESTPAQYLVGDHPEVARYLVERGARVDVFLAAALGDIAALERTLDENPDSVNHLINPGSFPRRNPHASLPIYFWTLGAHKSPHRVARDFNHANAFNLLMSRSSANLKIAVACEVEDESLSSQLNTQGLVVSLPLSQNLLERLVHAADLNKTTAVRMLLSAGWPVTALAHNKTTALHYAAFNGNAEMVDTLLKAGASTSVRDGQYGGIPRNWAEHGQQHSPYCQTGNYSAVLAALDA